MKLTVTCLFLLISVCAFANKPTCFEEKKEMVIPQTKFTLTTRGEISNGTQKFANLPLPKGFIGECLIATPIKSDILVILSLDAQDYDKKNAFVFRVSNKDSKVIWSQLIKNPVEPYLPFINEKVIIVPTVGEAVAINPEVGGIRWRFGSTETDTVDFKRFSINGAVVTAEGTTFVAGKSTNNKYELNVWDGKLLPPKKLAP